MNLQDCPTIKTALKTTTRPRRLVPALTLMAAVAGLPACADHVPVPVELASCPCGTGKVCCSSGVCAGDQNACGAATLALSQSAEGTWTGYLENFQLSNDDTIAISIAVDADGALSGQVVLGQEMPPAPPTDPDAIWPPTPTPSTPKLPTYIPGFAYDARNIRWEARRLRFSIAQNQPWQSWCQLQTSYQVGPDSYSCIPGNGGVGTDHGCFAQDDNGNIISEVPCFKLAGLCGVTGPCACDAAGCQSENLRGFTFDIALRDGVADGSTDLAGNINVRLTQTGH